MLALLAINHFDQGKDKVFFKPHLTSDDFMATFIVFLAAIQKWFAFTF